MILNDCNTGWNGLGEGGRFVDSGTYLYTAEVIDIERRSQVHTGSVTYMQ